MNRGLGTREVIRFGVYDLDLRARELRKQGRRISLQDKPFEVLAVLLERPGELVTREDLQRRLWPGDTFVVFDDNLNVAVKKARDALGDTPDGSRFIETVPRRGYRFVAPVDGNGAAILNEGVTPLAVPMTESASDATSGADWLMPASLAVIGFAVGVAVALAWLTPAPAVPLQIRELTFSGSDSEPAVSPDGKTVAFTSSRDGVSRIWLKQLETGGERALTGGIDRRPRFFGNGASLLFIRSDGGTDSAWRTPLVGGAPRLVAADVVEADPSPTDGRIAFVRLGHDNSAPVTILGLATGEGSQERTLLRIKNADLTSVRWSPDGATIGAVRRSPAGNETALVFVDVRTGSVRAVPGDADSGAYGALTWNGDGGSVIVTRSKDAQVNMPGGLDRVLRHDVGTGREETLLFSPNLFGPFRSAGTNGLLDTLASGALVFHTVNTRESLREVVSARDETDSSRVSTSGNAQDRQPAYSPDGQSLVFTSNRSGNYDLWMLARATGDLRQFTDDPAQDRDPAFTPDGRHVLWSSNRTTGHFEIWISNVDGTGQHQLSRDDFDAENPTIGRDSPWVVYASRAESEKRGIWRMKLDGSEPTKLVPGDLSLPDAAPNGKYVLYRVNDRARQQSTIRVVQIDDGRVVPFEIVVPYRVEQATENLTWGRARWTPDSKGIVFLGQDAMGRPCLIRQDFAPGQDTSGTRHRLVESFVRSATESFSLSPDGKAIAVADAFYSQSVIRADNVLRILPRKR